MEAAVLSRRGLGHGSLKGVSWMHIDTHTPLVKEAKIR
jgi:hypothetical protein